MTEDNETAGEDYAVGGGGCRHPHRPAIPLDLLQNIFARSIVGTSFRSGECVGAATGKQPNFQSAASQSETAPPLHATISTISRTTLHSLLPV